jgi:hypothetical protein
MSECTIRISLHRIYIQALVKGIVYVETGRLDYRWNAYYLNSEYIGSHGGRIIGSCL